MVTQKGLGSLHDSGLHMVTQCRGARYWAFGIFELGLCGAEHFGGGRRGGNWMVSCIGLAGRETREKEGMRGGW